MRTQRKPDKMLAKKRLKRAIKEYKEAYAKEIADFKASLFTCLGLLAVSLISSKWGFHDIALTAGVAAWMLPLLARLLGKEDA